MYVEQKYLQAPFPVRSVELRHLLQAHPRVDTLWQEEMRHRRIRLGQIRQMWKYSRQLSRQLRIMVDTIRIRR